MRHTWARRQFIQDLQGLCLLLSERQQVVGRHLNGRTEWPDILIKNKSILSVKTQRTQRRWDNRPTETNYCLREKRGSGRLWVSLGGRTDQVDRWGWR